MLITRVDECVRSILTEVSSQASPSAAVNAPEFEAALERAVTGGKRFRAICAGVGSLCVNEEAQSLEEVIDPQLLALGAALEQYQAAALVHDDVIDRSAERRGEPATQVALQQIHQNSRWNGDSEHFGASGAILVGDYLLAAADWALRLAAPETGVATGLHERFALMAAEVAYGQYLDLRASQTSLDADDPSLNLVDLALEVIRLKSARYSVVHPVVLGAIKSGGSSEVVTELSEIFEPAGLAFQLRDDHLGVFGNPAHTGKPTSSDIAERKRTVLLALTFAEADASSQKDLAEIYASDQEPTAAEMKAVRETVHHYGVEPHEALINRYHGAAKARLQQADLSPAAKAACRDLIDRLVYRTF